MIEIFDVPKSDGASVTVAEIAPEVCPRGLALELHAAPSAVDLELDASVGVAPKDVPAAVVIGLESNE